MDARSYLVRGTTVRSRTELASLLERWLRASNAVTLGDVASFGGSPCARVELEGAHLVLNVDTKRSAVERFVEQARREGVDQPWPVIANRRGRVNKVVFRQDRQETPGWYCCLTETLTRPGQV